MNHFFKLKFLITIILFLFFSNLYAQLSDLHYLPPLKQESNNIGIQGQAIYLSTPVITSFTVKVYRGASNTPISTFSISKSSPYVYALGNGDNNITFVDNLNTGIVLSNSGLRFESENGEKFYVNYRGAQASQGSSLTSKGRAALGKRFRWGGGPVIWGDDTNATLGIMASEDGTTVQIFGYDENIVFRKGEIIDAIKDDNLLITLNKGQSFVLEYPIRNLPNYSTSKLYDEWIGASIVSDKNIVVSLGNALYSPSNDGGRDIAIDQIIPENVLGNEYVFVRGYGADNMEFPIIIAIQNDTEIYVNDAITPVTTIDAGEYYLVPGSNYSGSGVTRKGENMYVRASKQIYAYQSTAGANNGANVDYNFIAPINFLLDKEVNFIPDIQKVGPNTNIQGGISIISAASTPDSDIQVFVNGALQSLAGKRKTINGFDSWVTYFLDGLTGNVSVISTNSIAVGYTGASGVVGVSGYFSGFETIPSINVSVNVVGNCLQDGNVILSAPQGYAIYQWYLEGTPVAGATQSTLVPNLAGSYTVGITQSVDGKEYVSAPVDVSDCLPEIKLDVTSSKQTLSVDESTTLRVNYKYQSFFSASNAEVTLSIPSNFQITANKPSVGSWSDSEKKWIIGNVNPGNEEVLELTLKAITVGSPVTVTANNSQSVFGSDNVTPLNEGNNIVDDLSEVFTIKNNTVINSPSPIAKTVLDADFPLVATSNNPNPFSYSSSNEGIVKVGTNGTVEIISVGSATITLSQLETETFAAGTSSVSVTVSKATPSLSSFPNINKTFGDPNFQLTAPISSSDGIFSYSSSNTAIATVNASTGLVTILQAGTAIITASQAATPNYNSSNIAATINISKAAQIITIGSLPDEKTILERIGPGGSDPSILISAISNAGSAVTISLPSGSIGVLSGSVGNYSVTSVSGPGTLLINFDAPENINFNSASISISLDVSKKPQNIDFSPAMPSSITFSDNLSVPITASSPSSTSMVYSVLSGPATISNGELIISGTGVVVYSVNNQGDAIYTKASEVIKELEVVQGTTTLSNFNITDITFDNRSVTIPTPTSNRTGDFIFSSNNTVVASLSGTDISVNTVGTVTIRATQPATENWTGASISTTFNVIKATPVLTGITTISKKTIDPDFIYSVSSTLPADPLVFRSSDLSVVKVNSSTGLISIEGIGTSVITASQAENTNYNSATISLTVIVEKADPSLGSISNIVKTKGDANFSITAPSSDSGGAFSFISSDTGVVTVNYITGEVSIMDTGTSIITINQGATANYNATSATVMVNILDIIKPLTDGSIKVEEMDAFKYIGISQEPKPIVKDGKTLLSEGTDYTLSYADNTNAGTATVMITGIGNYNGTISQAFPITKATLTITADNKSKVYGEENSVLIFTYSGLVSGDEKVATEPSIATTATASSGVGTYPITLTGGSDLNYEITLAAGELEITKASVTITAENKSKIYGEANPALTFTYMGLVNGDSQVSTEPSIATIATASSDVGTYPITLAGGLDANYDINLENGSLTVDQKALIITAENKSKVYGEANPALIFTYIGLVNGDAQVSTEPSISTTATASSKVGTYPITLTGGSDANYEITLAAGELEITKASVTITAENKSKVYGEANPVLTFTYTGLVNGDTQLEIEPSIVTAATASSNVGTYPITLAGGVDANYDITLVNGILTVGQKAVTITAENKSKVYGEANPALTFTYIGLVNGDTQLEIEPSIVTAATASSNVGTYPITLAGGLDANYDITLENGSLTVDQKALIITAENKSKVYGEANPALIFTYIGLVNGDTQVSTEPGIVTKSTASSNVGTYPITLTGGSDANYEITLAAGELEITKASVTITAESKSKVYGEANPALTFTYSGLVNGDEKVATEPSISTTATANSNVGTYPITLKGAADANYNITLKAGELEVTKATLTITADNKSNVYGQENPVLTFTYSGLVNGDEKVATEPSIATTATASSNVGTYPITLTGAADANYDITLKAGELEVTKAALTITADNKSKVYGEANPALTFIYTGLVNGDTQVATEPGIATTATESSNVGTYPISLTGGSDQNYAITLVNGTLTIGKKDLTITATDKTKVYGEANPALTFTYTGLVNGDTEVTTEPSIATTATASSNVGTYPITLSSGSDQNYAITLVNGTLTIGQKALTITADDKSQVYGEANPTLTFTYAGLVNGDTKVATEPSISTIETASSNVGSYPITLTDGSDQNYAITLVNGTLTIGKKDLTITADDKQKIYGEANPTLTFTYTGLVNGDTKVTTEPSISTTATASSNVGTYPISLTGGSDQNYAITLVNGTLTIGKKDLTIIADDKQKIYGEANPALNFTYSGLVNGDTKVTTEPSIATTATASSNVGSYPIILEGAADANYEITLIDGELEITKAGVTITATDKTKVYGEANPALTFTYTGLVNGDTKAATEPSIATTATASSNVGTYPITLTGAADANYDITLVAGELEVTKATLTIIADNKSKVYGEETPTLTFTYTGLVNGDTKAATEPSIATTATASSNVGIYPITLTGAADANYDITLVPGQLEVTQATLTISANEGQSKVFGTVDPILSYSSTGFAVEDNGQILTGNLTRDAGEAVGNYPINLGSLAAGRNYQIVYTSADFGIIPAVIEAVMQPAPIETVWGVYPGLPSTVTVMTTDGQFLALPITWDQQTLYVFGNGKYPLSATITLPTGILNTEALTVEIVVTVLPKPAPEDILLDNNSFAAEAGQNFIAVGNLTVIDPIDNQHDISLADLVFDNGYFQIINGTLFWNSEERADGRTTFKILVRVQDRDGNILEKEFTVIRNRTSVSKIEIFNTFSPNDDGKNDTWGVPDLRYYSGVRIQVFERSGKRLFYTENPDIRWDGTFKGKELPIGTYYWTIEVGETGEVRKGMLNLLRK